MEYRRELSTQHQAAGIMLRAPCVPHGDPLLGFLLRTGSLSCASGCMIYSARILGVGVNHNLYLSLLPSRGESDTPQEGRQRLRRG